MPLGFDDRIGAQALDQQQQVDQRRYSVFDGLLVSPGTDPMTVQCEAGRASLDDDAFDVGAQDNVGLAAADANYPRKDTVYLDSSMNLSVATGDPEQAIPEDYTHWTETHRPAPPVVQNAVVLAEVWVPPGADDIVADHVRDRRVLADTLGSTVGFDVLQDYGRFQMHHLNTWNFGGSGKVDEYTYTFDLDGVKKILLQCEHISLYTQQAPATFCVQYNGNQSGYDNYHWDGTVTTEGHAIVGMNLLNPHPFTGNIWMHLDENFNMIPEGANHGQAPSDHIDFATHENPSTAGTAELDFDSIRFFPDSPDPDDQIRMRRATMFGFTEGAN